MIDTRCQGPEGLTPLPRLQSCILVSLVELDDAVNLFPMLCPVAQGCLDVRHPQADRLRDDIGGALGRLVLQPGLGDSPDLRGG